MPAERRRFLRLLIAIHLTHTSPDARPEPSPSDPSPLSSGGRTGRLFSVRRDVALGDPGRAAFADQAGGSGGATLGQDTRMIFDSEQDGWVGYQVTRIAPDLQAAVRVFASGGAPLSLGVGSDEAGPYFSVEGTAGISLVRTASFDARIRQLASYGGGMRFCFFSPTPDSCEDGYEFFYDTAHFQKYELVRKAGGESTSLCGYQMDPNNTQHSDSITVDSGRLRDPDVEVHAHHGYLTVSFNGRQLCQVKDATFTEGFFVLADAPAISELTIDLNAGSTPVYATADTLADIQATPEPMRQGGSDDYNAFVTDYNAYLTAVAGGELPETFTHGYFNLFFGKGESDTAFEAIKGSKSMDDFLAYLEQFPRNSHRKEIEDTLFRLAREADTQEAYTKFEGVYPDSVARLDVKKRLADVQWRETVKKPTRKPLEKYLEQYPDGYYAHRARLLLEGLDYYARHKAEVDEARDVISQAQTLVEKSPVTAQWSPEIIDYQNGSIYFNLNNPPVVSKDATNTAALYLATHDQPEAYNNTCALLDDRIAAVDFCVVLFSRDRVDARQAFPPEEAIQDALTQFYLSRMDKGEDVNVPRVIELLDQMAAGAKDMRYAERIFLIRTYARLGLVNEAVYAFYRYALSAKKRDQVTSAANTLLKGEPGLAKLSDFQWVVTRFGEK